MFFCKCMSNLNKISALFIYIKEAGRVPHFSRFENVILLGHQEHVPSSSPVEQGIHVQFN